MFDSCFSGNAVRDIGSPCIGEKRYVKLDDEKIGRFQEDTIKQEPYPYKNIFYLSASSKLHHFLPWHDGKVKAAYKHSHDLDY